MRRIHPTWPLSLLAVATVIALPFGSAPSMSDETIAQAEKFQRIPVSPLVEIWRAGMETGDLSEWEEPGRPHEGGGEFNSDSGDAVATTELARTGQWSAKLSLPTGSGGTRLFRWRDSRRHQEAYYSAWFYFPMRYTPESWWNIFQFKSQTETRNDAFWVLNVGNRPNGAMYLYLVNSMAQRSFSQDIVDLPVGQWVNISCFLRQSAVAKGRLTCWQDETLLWDMSGITTRYLDGDNEWSVNNYSSGVAPSPTVVYLDDASVSLDPVYPDRHADTTVSGFASTIEDSATVADPGLMGWTARHGEGTWLSLTTTNGVGTGWLRWTKDASGLPPGVFLDTIVLNSPLFGDAELVDELTVAPPISEQAAARHLMVDSGLSPLERSFLDAQGNANGSYDLGDLMAWHDRCRSSSPGGCLPVGSN